MLNHLACETLALVRLACVDITLSQVVTMASSLVVLLISRCLVSLSDTHIMATILWIHSTDGCSKASGWDLCLPPHRGLHVLQDGPGYLHTFLLHGLSRAGQVGGDPHIESAHLQSVEQGDEAALSRTIASLTTVSHNSLVYLFLRRDSVTWVGEFVLLGLSSGSQTQTGLFVLSYLSADPADLAGCPMHLPMYFFLRNHLVWGICYTSSVVPQMSVHFLPEKKTISFA
ncbi:LOW QUALITY PROTEIN: hypothetical protein QTO34_004619 [Cnephaeus nilssonii]|uniref:Uncharacterized protein n=1 Tax=Cnephaeus nilssonii TaxID=3371016 RepID=A0AA40HPJ0_CNENI|nr:LOW QUALITY PROTEIN: hypothetical protein QTO34_004619 [Eptesicus nilssonii]